MSRTGDPPGGDAIILLDSNHHDIFAPDTLLASQFFAPRKGLPEAERSLVSAVLEDAVRCLLNHCRATDTKKRELYRTAEEWFQSTDRAELYAFENVCDILGLESNYLRRQLFAKRDQLRASDPVVTPGPPASSPARPLIPARGAPPRPRRPLETIPRRSRA
jgi:hypothetical protein